MKISVIIPSYNQGQFIKETIRSVLAQGLSDLEVRVYDGGSTDNTLSILRSYKNTVIWESKSDRGQAHAINRGLQDASGDILAYLNSDDVYYPGALKKVLEHFSRQRDSMIVYGDANHMWEATGVIEPYSTEPWNYDRLIDCCFLCQPAVFWRREVVERYGFFDESLHCSLDYEYWLRVGRELPFTWLQGECLAGSRMYQDNKTLSRRLQAHRENLEITLRYAERPPYRWLMVLAQIMVEEAYPDWLVAGTQQPKPYCREAFVAMYAHNVLQLADEYRIPLDYQFLTKLERDICSVA